MQTVERVSPSQNDGIGVRDGKVQGVLDEAIGVIRANIPTSHVRDAVLASLGNMKKLMSLK